MSEIIPDPVRARRATGALVFFTAGGAWLEYYAYHLLGKQVLVLAAIAVLTLMLLGLAWKRFKQNASALAGMDATPERRRANRIFHITNFGQVIAMIVSGNVLINLGLSEWVIPAIIAIVGLHFLPIAYAFAYRPHYLTGMAMIAVALGYPLLAPTGPASLVGCLLTGLILWSSALWAIVGKPSTAPAAMLRQGV